MIAPPASRNAPCPCGSGKRYKDCHGALAAAAPRPANAATPEIRALLDRARDALAAGDHAGAEALWREVLTADPDNAEANFHLANLRRDAGDPRAAIAGYERALRTAPGHAGVLNNLGLALEAAGQRDRAFECYQTVLAADPKQPDALGNLANALFDRNEFEAGADAYDRLFAIRRELPLPTLVRRGIALQRAKRPEEAEACFREAAKRSPDDAQILTNLGSLCIEQARYGDAEEPLARAYELDPTNPYTLSMLAHARAHRCQWEGIDALFAEIRGLLDADVKTGSWSVAPFPLHAMPLPPSTLLRAARRWARGFAQPRPQPRPAVRVAPGERLRVGFVSSDFRVHPVALLMMEVWEKLDRNRMETFGYGILPEDTGPTGRRIARAFEHFADLSAQPASVVAQRIRADGVAVLFDLNGYTQNANPAIFARRPAPLQINSIGFPGTLGAEWYDYIHVDRFVAPPEAQPHYTERFFHMPHAYVPSDTTRAPLLPPPSRAEYGLPSDAFVFCAQAAPYKILPQMFDVWMRLLTEVGDSVLWLRPMHAVAEGNLRAAARQRGIAAERLAFAPQEPSPRYLARFQLADLYLDTYPFGSHTTVNDALFAGVPVLTLSGHTMAARTSASQVRAAGLPELVASSHEEYGSIALALARDRSRLTALTARLRGEAASAPLFDMQRYARDLEDGLLRIWADYATGAAAASR